MTAHAPATTMTVWSQSRYGGPEVLTAATVARPVAGDGEVVVDVAAAALNSADVRIMRGDPLLVRLAFGLRRPRTAVPGRDVAGVVSAVGAGVTAWRVGDRVAGELSGGGLGDAVAAPADRLVAVPDDLDLAVAATLPLAGGTGWQALDLARVGEGSRVLVVGAGGGVGTFAVRLAVLRGAEVDALCGARAVPVIAGLGARRAEDYRGADLAAWEADAYDAVIDIAGSTPLRTLRRLVRAGGAVALVSGGSNRVTGPLGRILRAAVLSIGARRALRPLAAVARPEITARLLALAASGELVPPVERTWSLSEARAAMAHVDAGHTVGKVVVVR
ncbi:NAD(P)-dependent alcohol dehydrogenase [Microbacterium sp. T2.11-28]|uniref:NAD(P)-dependent alcohol dehydrogenase n=1 Tax=Microbacterium sp. T2.11-28 TaxID=3041169 RepID=UPI002477A8EB|nr:NAD(P)-dependent alcohol dehydrogenase [Microbacterium sp. T2.11-28]CAI9391339.1 Mycocerosic acid synthase [Microbacterium sp. T2.11-28]